MYYLPGSASFFLGENNNSRIWNNPWGKWLEETGFFLLIKINLFLKNVINSNLFGFYFYDTHHYQMYTNTAIISKYCAKSHTVISYKKKVN